MPEGPEVTMLSQYLSTKLKNRVFDKITVLAGKYSRKEIKNADKVNNKNYIIKNVDSKGKLMWIELDNNCYFVSHLGLAGQWSFTKSKNDKIRIGIKNKDNDKTYNLCYQDPRNFGNMEVFVSKQELESKTKLLAPDALKSNFTNNEFANIIKKYLGVSKTRKSQMIFKVLMDQTLSSGLVSGLGNYLTPEILYDCKISPYREIGSLTDDDITNLANSIKHVIKLSYYNNTTGYMSNFGDFIKVHKKRIDEGKYPNYNPDIILKATDKFIFKVYQKKVDPLGNPVNPDRTLNPKRTTYWVPSMQK